MSVIYFLIGIGIVVAGGFLVAFIWAVKSGQYDDDYTPSVRILFEDSTSAGEIKDNGKAGDSNEMKKSNINKS